MRVTGGILAWAAGASAATKGFNYGSTFTSGAAKQQTDFEAEFSAAQKLAGAPGFTSARLYTMIQGGTTNSPISAIQAAINTKTSLLLGLWTSAGDTVFGNELTALKSAIDTYGSAFTSIVEGISVGSEDLYRNSAMGQKNGENPGVNPEVIASYIDQVKKLISGTGLKAPIGHVDTWTAWANGSNKAVVDACDWIGTDAYPYFQDTMSNAVALGRPLFDDALGQTQAAAGGKPVWVTETGWPVSGKTVGQAVPSTENAKKYWDEVGCNKLFGQVNTWWYTLQDAAPDMPNPSFGLVGTDLNGKPLFDLSCSASSSSSSTGPSQSATTMSTAMASATGNTGGSPGIGGNGQSSQISLEASATGSVSVTVSAANPGSTSGPGSGRGGSGSGSSSGGSSSGSASGSGSGSGGNYGSSSPSSGVGSGPGAGGYGSNSTITTGAPKATQPPTASGASSDMQSGAYGALVAAIVLALAAF